MPLSVAGKNLFTRKSQLGGGATADELDIDGLDDIGADLADADLLIIDDGGGGTNRRTAVTRIPTYVFTALVLDEDNMASDSAAKFATQQSIKAYVDARSITVSDGSNSTAITMGNTMTFSGTNNEVTVAESSGTITIGLPDNVTIAGNLTVSGTTTTVSSSTVTVNDPLFALADNNSGDAVDIGWYGKYVDSGTKYSGLFRDASDSDKWKLFATTGNSNEAPSTTVNTTSGFALASFAVGGLEATSLTLGGTAVSSTAAELNILDGVTSTAAELNIIDGGTSATSTTVADADRVVLNDNGTMVQVAVTDLAAYFDDEITAMPNLVSTGALDGGSITSGFGTINTGASAITTTGLISGGSLDIDDVLINGTNIGHTDDTDLMTLSNGTLTIAGEISVATLDIGGTNVTSTAAELNILDGVTSTAAELNLLDGVTSTTTELNIIDGDTGASTVTLADADRVVVNDGGTMKQVALTSFETYFETALDTLANVTTVGTIGTGVWEATDVAVAHGGTGASSLTANGVLIGNGTSAVTAIDLSTKGDILLGDGSGNPQALNVGSNDYILTADSTSATGVAWKAAGLGAFYLEDDDGTELSIGANKEVKIIGSGLTSNWTDTDNGTDGDPFDLTLTIDTSQPTITTMAGLTSIGAAGATTNIVAGDVTMYNAVNDGNPTISLGSSANERLLITANYTGSAQTLASVEFATATALTGADAGKFVFDVDGTDIATIDDGGIDLAAGLSFTVNGSAISTDNTMGDGFVIEDDDGTEVTLTENKEMKIIGSGVTTNWTDTSDGSDGDPYDLTITVDAAQTGITSIYATDLILGEDSQTAIDFGTVNEIDFKVDNAARLTLTASALYPVTNNQIDLGTSSLEFKDAFFDGTVTADAFAGPLTGNVTGTADVATVATTVTITDNESTNENNAVIFTAGGDVDGGNLGLESDGNLTYNPSNGTLTATAFSGALTGNVTGTADVATVATTVTITDNENTNENNAVVFTAGGDVDGGNLGLESDGNLTYNPSSGTLTATAFSGALTGNVTGTADVATVATTVTITDNESTDEDNAIIFTAGGDVDGGNIGLESDGTLTYNPSTGVVTATGFAGALTGNVTGNASGTAATVTGAAQSNITSLGTLTALTVDDVAVDGKVITMTGSSSDTAVMTVAANGAFSLVTTDAAAAAANVQITADGTVDIDSAGVLTLDSGAAINIEPASGSAILLDGTISIDAGVVTGATSITSTAFVGDITGDVTGTADVATVATTVTITDNENTNETNAIIFTAGGDVDGGNIGLESDGDLTYNPSSGTLSATALAGTLSTAAQGNVTSLGTLTALTVDDVAVNGKVITMTGSTDDTAVMTVATNGALTIETTDTAAAAANIQITADGTAELAGTTVTLDSAGAVVLDSATGIVNIQDGGSTVLSFTEGNSGDVTVKLETNAKDLVFTDNGDATNMKILDAAAGINVPGEVQTTGIAFTDGDNAMTIVDGGAVTFPVSIDITGSAGIILENDETITNSTNGQVDINGNVMVGSGSGNATVKSSGNHDIIVQTGNSTTGSITITDGANGDITLAPNGTGEIAADSHISVADSHYIELESAAGTPGTDDSAQGIVIEFLAAEAITQWDAVYVSTTTGRVGRADATNAAKMPVIGIAIEPQGSAGSAVRVLTHGVYRDDGGFGGNMTVGVDLYAPETAGNLTTTRPSDDDDFVQVIGVAIGVRSAFINPDLTVLKLD